MTKDEILDALASLHTMTGETAMLVIGSQSLHATHPDVPDKILLSREVDVVLSTRATMFKRLNEDVGVYTRFWEEHGYHIDHVIPKEGMPVLAANWESRVTERPDIRDGVVQYLSPEDLVIAKLGAGRDKDIAFISGMCERNIVSLREVQKLIPEVPAQYHEKIDESLVKVGAANLARSLRAKGFDLAPEQLAAAVTAARQGADTTFEANGERATVSAKTILAAAGLAGQERRAETMASAPQQTQPRTPDR